MIPQGVLRIARVSYQTVKLLEQAVKPLPRWNKLLSRYAVIEQTITLSRRKNKLLRRQKKIFSCYALIIIVSSSSSSSRSRSRGIGDRPPPAGCGRMA